MIRRILYGIICLIFLGLLGAASCSSGEVPGKEPGQTPEQPGPDNPDPGPDTPEETLTDISRYVITGDFEMFFGGVTRLPVSGVSAGDYVELQSRADASVTWRADVVAAGDSGIDLRTPETFIGGMCKLTFHAGSKTISYGPLFVRVTDTTSVSRVAGKTLYGRVVDSQGRGIGGVVVSDGILVNKTDVNGCYYMSSSKKSGFVFVSVPSGYRVAVRRSIPQFFARTGSVSSQYEQYNFVLEAEENTRHRALVFTDTHLANRTKDVQQYETFKSDLRDTYNASVAEGIPAYGIALGDLAWDEYWVSNKYDLQSYCSTMADLDIPVYSVPGNHDNDPDIADDLASSAAWRENFGPMYYSFNIGGIHYIMMDDTIINDLLLPARQAGKSNYVEGFTSDEVKWLRNDVASVDKGVPIFIGMHIQYTNRYNVTNGTWSYSMPADTRSTLSEILAGRDVHFITGHTHISYTNRISDSMIEHNILAVCGTWWWTGYYTSFRCQICRDGCPSGYKVFDFGKASATDISWQLKPIGHSADYQFRAYDLNNCLISREQYCPKASSGKVSDDFFKEYACGYDEPRSDNAVLLNVFDWDPTWTVSMTENGREIPLTQVDTYDPLHVVHFNMARMKSNSTSMTFPTLKTSHMFTGTCLSATSSVVIKVTDPFGRVYTETMTRPRKLLDMTKSSDY